MQPPIHNIACGRNEADLTILANPTIALLSLGFILIASIGKFSGAFLGSRLGGMTTGEGIALAFGMNARGSTEVIVAAIGLSMGVLSQDLYTMIVTMAIVTTMAMPPSLRWALNRLPLTDEEKERLENDEADARGFVVLNSKFFHEKIWREPICE